jgi:Zn-dependent protease with chaperone function
MSEPRRRGWRRHHLLGFLPTVGMLGGIVCANRVRPLVLGMPFLFAWIAAWVLATSLVMWCILTLDRAQEREADEVAATEQEGAR